MSTNVIEDDDSVIKAPHASLVNHCSLDKLEKDVYNFLNEDGKLPLSSIWKRFGCHLWEMNYVLKRLKEKGLIEEKDLL
jgi:DNA-binding Lrp family transcriptional regulator